MNETDAIEKKSLRVITGKRADWQELAKDCVCMANSRGGTILIGIEKHADQPEGSQVIEPDLIQELRRRIPQLTVNVGITTPTIETSVNGGQYIQMQVLHSAQTIASTTDGRYFMRVSDSCQPVPPDQIVRLAAEKNAFVWELQTTARIPRTRVDEYKLHAFFHGIRNSDRVSDFVKEKSDDELLSYYSFTADGYLTNLGILWIGLTQDRKALRYSPCIQFIRYNEREEKIRKEVFDDYTKNPIELLDAIRSLSDWKESIEIPDGIFRQNVPIYDEQVVRELVANALVHRPYTTAGDIYINHYTDRLEVHNPGRLPLGVNPDNILHQSVRRNEHLAKVFYDLKLMEREGSGYDKIYEVLLAGGKKLPIVEDRDDRVKVKVFGKMLHSEAVRLMDKISRDFQLRQKELIALGIIAQHNTLSLIELRRILALKDSAELNGWLDGLLQHKLLVSRGRTKGTQYSVNPDVLRQIGYKGKTTLKSIEEYRLRELIVTDLRIYPQSRIGQVHERIGLEIPRNKVQHLLYRMTDEGVLHRSGTRKAARYRLAE